MVKRRTIDIQILKEALAYDENTGKLTWKTRPEYHFTRNKKARAVRATQWNAQFAGKEAFTFINPAGYHMGTVCAKHFSAHRVIWALYYGEWPDGEVDHINGIRSDNRIANLRCVSRSENQRNQALASNNTSGVIGVRWCKRDEKWRAQIGGQDKRVNLGSFKTKREAIAARRAAEKVLNFHKNHGRQQP